MISNYPLFFPNVSKAYTKNHNLLIDERLRIEECKKSLINIISYNVFSSIILVDGSDTKIFDDFELNNFKKRGIEIEQLVFQQNISEVERYGKSQGEMQITNFMIDNSLLINKYGGFCKLSPRYSIDNFSQIFPKINHFSNVFFFYQPIWVFKKNKFVATTFYKCSVDFYKAHLYNGIRECNNCKDGFLESVFYRRLFKLKKRSIYVDFLFHSGISGTTGKPMVNNHFKIRNLFSRLGFLCFNFESH